MRIFMQWLHMMICIFATIVLFISGGSTNITKEQFLICLVVYGYMIMLLIALFKEDY